MFHGQIVIAIQEFPTKKSKTSLIDDDSGIFLNIINMGQEGLT